MPASILPLLVGGKGIHSNPGSSWAGETYVAGSLDHWTQPVHHSYMGLHRATPSQAASSLLNSACKLLRVLNRAVKEEHASYNDASSCHWRACSHALPSACSPGMHNSPGPTNNGLGQWHSLWAGQNLLGGHFALLCSTGIELPGGACHLYSCPEIK